MVIKTCLECKIAFQDNVKWLAEKLMNGNFHRTASVLCPDG